MSNCFFDVRKIKLYFKLDLEEKDNFVFSSSPKSWQSFLLSAMTTCVESWDFWYWLLVGIGIYSNQTNTKIFGVNFRQMKYTQQEYSDQVFYNQYPSYNLMKENHNLWILSITLCWVSAASKSLWSSTKLKIALFKLRILFQ